MNRVGILVILILSEPATIRAGDGFTPLFNGKDLTGWVIENEGKFSVRDGVIVLDKGSGWLRSDRQYEDFELRLDFRFLNKGADTGILVRAGKEGKNWPAKTYQVQTMDNESIAGLYVTGLAKPKVKRDVALMRQHRKPSGEWQSYAITLKGNRAEIALNGALITVADGLTVQPGHIGLKGQGAVVEFRNIRLKDLK